MREGECEVDYFQTGYLPSEVGILYHECQPDTDFTKKLLMPNTHLSCVGTRVYLNPGLSITKIPDHQELKMIYLPLSQQ